MQTKIILPILGALLIGGLIGFGLGSSFGGGHVASDESDQNAHEKTDDSQMTEHQAMNPETMSHSNMIVTDERVFLEKMIPHHQEAVDASFALLPKNPSPEVRALAESIIENQSAEIDLMRGWYQEWYGELYEDDGSYVPMMRDSGTISAITTIERMFLEDMIMHHLGAIMMVESVKPHVKKTELADLVANIAETQMLEMELMNKILQAPTEVSVD
jgi:uncharacterized protein (DUF305 family)